LGSADAPHFVELGNVSPVVKALATEQFDNYVKRARIFVTPDRAAEVVAADIHVAEELLKIVGS
jgi:hypothetical protein